MTPHLTALTNKVMLTDKERNLIEAIRETPYSVMTLHIKEGQPDLIEGWRDKRKL